MTEKGGSLAPIEQRTIDFHGDRLVAVLMPTEGGEAAVYVPVRPLCEYLGLSWAGQSERMKRDPVLSAVSRFVRVTRTNRGGNPNMLALPVEFVHGWLFGVDASRVKPELRERLNV